jgi:hypothetical protein
LAQPALCSPNESKRSSSSGIPALEATRPSLQFHYLDLFRNSRIPAGQPSSELSRSRPGESITPGTYSTRDPLHFGHAQSGFMSQTCRRPGLPLILEPRQNPSLMEFAHYHRRLPRAHSPPPPRQLQLGYPVPNIRTSSGIPGASCTLGAWPLFRRKRGCASQPLGA